MSKKFLATCIIALVAAVQVRASNATIDVVLDGSQKEQSVQLEGLHDKQVVDKVIPYQDTCYRDEYDGTKTECESVPHQECNTSSEYRCHTEYRQECHDVPDRDCRIDHECHDDRVCHIENNTRVCEVVQQCSDVRNCTDTTRTECSNVPYQDCNYEPVTSCHTEYRQECHEEPQYKSVPYSCTKYDYTYKTVSHSTKADLNVVMGDLPAGVKVSDKLNLKIADEKLVIGEFTKSDGSPTDTLWFLDKKIDEQVVSATEKTISGQIAVAAVPLPVLKAPVASAPQGLALADNALSFIVPEIKFPELYVVHVTIKKKSLFSSKVVVDEAVNPQDLVLTAGNASTKVTIDTSKIGFAKGDRKSGTYEIKAEISTYLKKQAVNQSLYQAVKNSASVKVKLKE